MIVLRWASRFHAPFVDVHESVNGAVANAAWATDGEFESTAGIEIIDDAGKSQWLSGRELDEAIQHVWDTSDRKRDVIIEPPPVAVIMIQHPQLGDMEGDDWIKYRLFTTTVEDAQAEFAKLALLGERAKLVIID